MEKPKMDDPEGSGRYGRPGRYLGHPVLGAIIWIEPHFPWNGSVGELLNLLNDNVADRIRRLSAWPSSPQELYEHLRSLDGYLFPLYGGDVEIELRDHFEEHPEETKVLIELVFPDDFEDDDPEGEEGLHIGFELDFDWIAPEERDEG